MSESKPNTTVSLSDRGAKEPDIFERAKEEIEAVLQTVKTHHNHHEETHGMREDIDENTPLGEVKAPNVFERAKEEIEALVEAIHQKKESQINDKRDQSTKAELNHEQSAEKDAKGRNLIERAKEEFGAIFHSEKLPTPHHHKETHGMSNAIDESTPLNEVKAPNVFERAKEEVEAILETFHPNKKE